MSDFFIKKDYLNEKTPSRNELFLLGNGPSLKNVLINIKNF